MLWDTHMHTAFSGDSDTAPDHMAVKAIELGLPGICITDHLDYDYPQEPEPFDNLDLAAYVPAIHDLQIRFKDRLPILFGVEIGLQPHLADLHKSIVKEYDFDYVIGSSHTIHGVDPYYPVFFEGKSQEEAYREYFSSILENLSVFDDFDSYGHIDYVVRYGPSRNIDYCYDRYGDLLDAILQKLITMGKGLEVNTAGFKYGLGHPNPQEDIIRRYIQLGGEIVTIGSDAHKPEHIAYSYDKLPELLKDCGVSYYHIFRNRQALAIKL